MGTEQRKFGLAMIESCFLPASIDVAVRTVLSQGLLVNVVLPMAGHTLQGRAFESALHMAIRAADPGMFAGEWKTGFPMIEGHLLPVPFAMAIVALAAEGSGMDVVFSMAAHTIPRGLRQVCILVAGRTFGLDMPAAQGKARLVVVKAGFLPVGLSVTLRAISPQRSLVDVVLLMTTGTLVRRIPMFFPDDVAGRTFRRFMFSEEDEIGQPMIEAAFVQDHNPGIPAQMLCVTVAAGFVGVPSMESAVGEQVFCGLLVTIKTQRVLVFFFEWLVTLATLPLDLRMTGDDFPGHDERL